jgi:UMF1 family MFS transporter
MVYSDAAFLIGSIGGLYANQYVDWQCFPKSIGILLMFFIVPVAAMIGNLGLLKCGQRFQIRGKRMLIAVLAICCIVPAYALIGFFSMQFGVRKGWEMIVVATVYGFVIGPIQSYSRSVFASLIPKGKEVAFFSFFELTNRGSSALGPIVLTAIQQGTGDLRYGALMW